MNKHVNWTFIKFFLSYLLIFIVSIVSIGVVYRSELIDTLTDQFEHNVLQQINTTVSIIDEDIKEIHTLNEAVVGNVNIVLSKYTDSPARSNNVRTELQKYIVGNHYVLAAVYIDRMNDRMYSYNKQYYLKYSNGEVVIHSYNHTYIFNPERYLGAKSDTLLYIESEGEQCLIYFPVNYPYYNYLSFYILDNSVFSDACASLISENVTGCVITDGTHIFGEANMAYIPSQLRSGESDVISLDNYSSLCVSEPFIGGLRICALSSGLALRSAISSALYRSLPLHIIIIVLGLLLVFALTYFTYYPLSKLAHRMKDDSIRHSDPLRILDLAMTRQKNRSIDLEEKIDYYRTLIKKSVLDSLINAADYPSGDIHNFDYLFAPNVNCRIAVLACEEGGAESLPGMQWEGIDYGVLTRKDGVVFFLLSEHANEEDAPACFENKFMSSLQSGESRYALSSISTSVLDMPKLYAQAERLFARTSAENRVIGPENLPENDILSDSFDYPGEQINQFEEALRSCEFDTASSILDRIFDLLTAIPKKNESIPDFFIRNVLIDTLSVLTLCMNDMKMPFADFENLYLETLYLCRSCAYENEENAIRSHFAALMRLYEKKTGAVSLSAEMIELIMKENLSNPDFGISNVYDKYDISIAYMSYLFKKETGMGFSDYLWKLRFEKACELLKEGKLSIDEISLKVGYLHSSSFRRKFKQETGFSPTEYSDRR